MAPSADLAVIMDLMDCTGCGFTFSTRRGVRGNFFLSDGSDMWFMNHECEYCGTVTHVGKGELLRIPKPRQRRLEGSRG